jgi:hypothetical protein
MLWLPSRCRRQHRSPVLSHARWRAIVASDVDRAANLRLGDFVPPASDAATLSSSAVSARSSSRATPARESDAVVRADPTAREAAASRILA